MIMSRCHKSASIATGIEKVKPETLNEVQTCISSDITATHRSFGQSQVGAAGDVEIRTTIIRSLSEIDNIRHFWSLWQNHPNADVDFYLTTARSYPGFVRPHILVVYRGTSPEAILIGRIEQGCIEYKLGYRTLLRPKALIMNFVYAGVLGNLSPELCESVVDTVSDSLRCGEADLAVFKYLRVDSPLYNKITRWSSMLRRSVLPVGQAHLTLMLPAGTDGFRRVVPKNMRKNHRWNSLLRDYSGNVRIACLGALSDLDQILQAVEEIARKTYQRALGLGFVNDEATGQRLRLEAEKEWLRAYVLYIEDRPCAFWLGTLYKGVIHGNYVGFDPAYGKYSPGMFLMIRVIEQLCSNGDNGEVSQIDWGLGGAHYKETLSTSQWQEASVHIFAPTFKGYSLNLLMTSTTLSEQLVRKTMGKTVLTRIRKLWRGQPGTNRKTH
jgi:hypothetical protein